MKSYLMHHGILGQKWGVRRYENPDGTLTEAGKKRYNVIKKLEKEASEHQSKMKEGYDKSEEAKAYKKWRKENPNADEDDFGDFMVDNDIPAWEGYVSNRAEHEKEVLTGERFANDMLGTTVVTAFALAPIVSLGTAAVTKSGKKAAASYLITLGAMSTISAVDSIKERIKTEKKYGLRK